MKVRLYHPYLVFTYPFEQNIPNRQHHFYQISRILFCRKTEYESHTSFANYRRPFLKAIFYLHILNQMRELCSQTNIHL